MSTNNQLTEIQVQELLKAIVIPPQPAILMAIMREKDEGNADPREIARLISSDMGLSAAVLKTINSSFYGLRDKVVSIDRAVSLLGIKNISTLVMGFSLRSIAPGPEMEAFWEHSTRTALVSSYLAKAIGGIDRDEAHLFGLFHDCGQPLMMQRFGDYKETVELGSTPDHNLIESERDRHTINHMQLGVLLARAWELPTVVRKAIGIHHELDVFTSTQGVASMLNMIAIGHLAEYIITGTEASFKEEEWDVYKVDLMAHLDLSPDQLNDLIWDTNELLLESEIS